MYRKSVHGWMKHSGFILIDLICLQTSFLLAYAVRNGFTSLPYNDPDFLNLSVVMILVDVVSSVVLNTFAGVRKRGFYKEFAATVKHVITVFAFLAYYLFFLQAGNAYSRIVFSITMLMYALTGYVSRLLCMKYCKSKKSQRRSLLIITTEEDAEYVIKDMHNYHDQYRISGLALLEKNLIGKSIVSVPVVASSDTVIDYVCNEWIDEALVHLPAEHPEAREIIEKLIHMGVVVHVSVVRLFGITTQGQIVESVGNYAVLTSSLNFATPLQFFIKRTMDIIGGFFGCILAAFVCLLVAPFILKESPGPLFFVQERVGIHGKRFKIYKIRSMYLDAEERKKELLAENRISGGLMFKLDWDPRIIGNMILPDGTRKTGIGQIIREISLDEFPQFLNVLKGDMSLVGTRPPTVDEWKKYKLHHHARLSVKPGLTGMWQVSGRSEITDFERVVKLDMEFIDKWSMGLEFRILFRTVKAVFAHNGAM